MISLSAKTAVKAIITALSFRGPRSRPEYLEQRRHGIRRRRRLVSVGTSPKAQPRWETQIASRDSHERFPGREGRHQENRRRYARAQLQLPKFSGQRLLHPPSAAKGNITITSVVQGGATGLAKGARVSSSPRNGNIHDAVPRGSERIWVNNVTFQIGYTAGWVQVGDVQITPMENPGRTLVCGAEARIDSLRKTTSS